MIFNIFTFIIFLRIHVNFNREEYVKFYVINLVLLSDKIIFFTFSDSFILCV